MAGHDKADVAERVRDSVFLQRAVGAVGAHPELAVAHEETALDALVLEAGVGEIAAHGLGRGNMLGLGIA